MKDIYLKKVIVLLLKPMTKTSQVLHDIAVKSKADFFRRALCRKWPFEMAA